MVQALGPNQGCANPCAIADQVVREGDSALLEGAPRERLYFKCGERDGVEDSNKDRSYGTQVLSQYYFLLLSQRHFLQIYQQPCSDFFLYLRETQELKTHL